MNGIMDPTTIQATARGVMPAGMATAEQELATVQCRLAALNVQIHARGAFRSSLKPAVSPEDRQAAQHRLNRLNKEALHLHQLAAAARETMGRFAEENAIAVCATINPVRKAAAKRVVSGINELIWAIESLNAASICLRESGTPAAILPIPLLDGMKQIAQSILTAESPALERR